MKTLAFFLIFCTVGLAVQPASAGKKADPLDEVKDHKEFKKLLRTKGNVLVSFYVKPANAELNKVLKEVAKKIKGIGTVVAVNCDSGDGKKLCKKLKIDLSAGQVVKHYHEGEYHKDYDRLQTVASMVNFMRDPKGDAPWEEDPASADVLHIANEKHLNKVLKTEKGRLLIMFYAPWCGFCKKLKPDYQAAAAKVKGTAVMAAIDVNQPNNNAISRRYNISGFPTLIYFEGGAEKYPYPGENNLAGLVEFLNDPKPEDETKAKKKEEEEEWKEEASEVVHLTDTDFDEFLAENPSVMVMFYAPWCGHCKAMKPKYAGAAAKLKAGSVGGKLAAVDCTKERELASRFNVKGFPTVKYFVDGELAFDVGHIREEAAIVDFMKDPKEPPPPPPPEAPWSEEKSDVVHLTEETFKPFLKKRKYVLVMFYAPWCGHCKKAKPELVSAAHEFRDNSKVEFGAVDCTVERSLCSVYDVAGFPTFKFFKYFSKDQRPYDGGRTKADFVAFMRNPENPSTAVKPPPEDEWKGLAGAEHVVHLTAANFKAKIGAKDHALVMFYAPWCGHCKAMKADYAAAAKRLADEGAPSTIAAVDVTVERDLGENFQVKGFPTIKYFFKGQETEEYNGGRQKTDFVDFMKAKAHFWIRNEL